MTTTSLADRLKSNYEDRYRFYLPRRIPVMLRIDGQHFSSYTKKCKKPFDDNIINAMREAAIATANKMQGFKLAYAQSDEVSFLITDFDTLKTDAWFDYNKSKIETITASMFAAFFNDTYHKISGRSDLAFFDCRSYSIPKEEVANAFLWRSQDWNRNSIQMLAQSVFSHKELHKKNTSDMHEMLYDKKINWSKLEDIYKNGTFIISQKGSGLIVRTDIHSKYNQINEIVAPFLQE